LQRLGKVVNITPTKSIIIKTEQAPKTGLQVVDENFNVIGTVFDVIGPVSAPYAVIKPTIKDASALANKPVYLLFSKTKRSKKNE
jgi:rRNA processing protein Gar1